MKLDNDRVYFGFAVKKTTFIEELKADAFILEHVKSGATLL